jgi:hypothetical protein
MGGEANRDAGNDVAPGVECLHRQTQRVADDNGSDCRCDAEVPARSALRVNVIAALRKE